MKHRKWLSAGVVLLSAFTLAACSNDDKDEGSSSRAKLPSTLNYNQKGTTAGNNSTLKVAEVNDSPFAGISSQVLQTNLEDSHVYSPGGGNALFNNDDQFKIVDGGLANLKLDKNSKTATITIRDNAKWSNGMKVTAKDVEYPYEMIANKNSQSQQYSADMNAIEGLKDYHDGKAQTISGITFPKGEKGNVVKIKFNKFSPALKTNGNSFIWSTVEPYEYYKGLPINKISESDQVRKNPIFTGPYKLKKQVTGESTSWVPNKYYWGQKPKVKNITIQVVSTSNFSAALKAKKYDFTFSGISSQYDNVKKLKDYQVVGAPALSFSYFGFNLGHRNNDGESVLDKNKKMSNKSLRKAMAYGIDLDAVSKKFSHGLSWRANSLLPPVFKNFNNEKTVKGFPYDEKKANELLDKAGYKKKGKWRVQPNGKPLKINYGAMQGSPTSLAINQFLLQQWQKLGLNVKFAGGKPVEMNSFYSTLLKPNQNKFDVYSAAFSTNSEPTPTGLFGSTASYNMGHFATKKNDQLMDEMNNDKAWDSNYRKNKFVEWQKYMNDEAGYIPQNFSLVWTPVNKRVVNYTQSNSTEKDLWANLQLNSDKLK